MRGLRLLPASLACLAVLGCAYIAPQPSIVRQPTTARPEAPPAHATRNPGAIYQAGGDNPLFEDRRPRRIGDLLTIIVTERTNATKNSATSASRSAKLAEDLGVMPKALGGLLAGQGATAAGDSSMSGKGGASATNAFNAEITVTVVEVLANGNLVVSGEKQMLINQGTEFIRFSGVVNPRTMIGTNTVLSTQVADARIEYSGKGFIDEAQTMGWLQRFFLNVMPF